MPGFIPFSLGFGSNLYFNSPILSFFLQLYKPLSDFIPPPLRVRKIPQNVHNSVITLDFCSLSSLSASPRSALGEDGAFRVIANVVCMSKWANETRIKLVNNAGSDALQGSKLLPANEKKKAQSRDLRASSTTMFTK